MLYYVNVSLIDVICVVTEKWTNIISKCRHSNKHLLKRYCTPEKACNFIFSTEAH